MCCVSAGAIHWIRKCFKWHQINRGETILKESTTNNSCCKQKWCVLLIYFKDAVYSGTSSTTSQPFENRAFLPSKRRLCPLLMWLTSWVKLGSESPRCCDIYKKHVKLWRIKLKLACAWWVHVDASFPQMSTGWRRQWWQAVFILAHR